MKNKLISLILMLALLAITAPMSVYGADSATLNPLSGVTAGDTVTVTGTSSLSEVAVKVVHPNKTIVYLGVAAVSSGLFSLQIKLPEDLTAGTYTVVAGSSTVTAATTLSVAALPPTQLSQPAKPNLAGKIATWTAVTNENNGYSLQLYKGGSAAGSAVTIAHGAALSYSFSSAMSAAGSYTVTVTALGSGKYSNSVASDPSNAQVVEAPVIAVTGVSLNKSSTSILKGHSEALAATVEPPDATNRNVTWSSNKTNIASVDNNGNVTGVAAGTATITVTTADGGKTDTCLVTVAETSITVTGVSLNKSSISISAGSSEDLSVAITPSNATNQNVTWSSNNTSAATVNTAGKVTAVAAGTATITVTTEDGSKTAACQVTVTSSGGSGGGDSGDSGSGGHTDTPPPNNGAKVTGTDPAGKPIPETALPVTVDQNTGSATVDIGSQQGDIINSGGTAVITIPPISGTDTYTMGIPVAYLTTPDGKGSIDFNTDTGGVTLPANMLAGVAGAEGKKAEISISQGDKSSLPEAAKAAVGDRPLIQLTLTLDGKQTEWNNPGAPVTVSIPYKPTAEELKGPEHITVWYIDGNGKAVSVPSGKYDPATGTVTFETTHFSKYAVAYVQKTFGDLGGVSWAKKQVEVMASKGIISGTSENSFSPAAKITRADYLVLLVKTLGLTAEFNGNFADVAPGSYYYEAIGIAKELGIAGGSNDNRFNPKERLTRQDMMALTARALEKYNGLEAAGDSTVLDQFKDRADIADYAVESLAALVKAGLIAGSGETINPRGYTTRAEAAVFLYRIYNM